MQATFSERKKLEFGKRMKNLRAWKKLINKSRIMNICILFQPYGSGIAKRSSNKWVAWLYWMICTYFIWCGCTSRSFCCFFFLDDSVQWKNNWILEMNEKKQTLYFNGFASLFIYFLPFLISAFFFFNDPRKKYEIYTTHMQRS